MSFQVTLPLVLGVDPGLTGAIAALDIAGTLIALEDLPVIRDRSLAWVDAALLPRILEFKAGRPITAIVERQQAMPRQGVSSSFTTGVAFGSLLAILQVAACGIEFVTAATWKRAMGLSSDKRASLDKARLLFPTADLSLTKHDGRAEALLLAHYGLTRARAAA